MVEAGRHYSADRRKSDTLAVDKSQTWFAFKSNFSTAYMKSEDTKSNVLN